MAEEGHGEYHTDDPADGTVAGSQDPSDDDDDDDEFDDDDGPPKHPIPSMQGPFEESIEDAASPEAFKSPVLDGKLGAKARRQKLLDTNQSNDTYNARWRTTPESKYHPLMKIIAQIAFGVHLLQQQLAKSDEEVVKILQRHVDEVDSFVQRSEEDLDLAIVDIQERINYLKLPLEHVNIFDVMLEDKQFRSSIIQGNDRIEQVVNRTSGLMNDLQVDMSKGMEAITDMAQYLHRVGHDWPLDDSGSVEIYHTMQANAEGWLQCLGSLQMKGNSLGVALVQLGSILNEMSKRAGVASRKSLLPAPRPSNGDSHRSSRKSPRKSSPRVQSPAPLSRYSRKAMKPLPQDPDLVARAVEATLPRRDNIPFEQRFENPRQSPTLPRRSMSVKELYGSPVPQRNKPTEIANFIRNTSSEVQSPRALEPEPEDPQPQPKRRSKHEPKAESKPESTLKRARSKLKRKSYGALADKLRAGISEDRAKNNISPLAPDSAYSSGTDVDKRPRSAPTPVPRPPAHFNLFPSTPPSIHSIKSPPSLHSNRDSEKEAVLTALPPMPSKSKQKPSPLKRSSAPATSTLKKRSSLTALKRFFKKEKNGSALRGGQNAPIYELPA